MKRCAQCDRQNQEDARFCHQCGRAFALESKEPTESKEPADQAVAVESPAPAAPLPQTDTELLKAFIGPNADRYLETFKKFTGPSGHKFALTWHWPAFLFEPFLWFLYRKMYVYALIYAIGPAAAFYITQDLSADIVWRLIAAGSANYIYFWHAREQLAKIKEERAADGEARQKLLGELGGVQPYVVWVGVALLVLKIGLAVTLLRDGPPDGLKGPTTKPRPAAHTVV